MVDLIPEGCISLHSAFKRLDRRLWGENAPITGAGHELILNNVHPCLALRCRASLARVESTLLEELVVAFASESLEAFVRPPGSNENYTVPADSWDSAFFAGRAFLAQEIMVGHGGYWDGLVGRTLFLRRELFDQWVEKQVDRRRNPLGHLSAADQALRGHLIGMAKDGILPSTEIENLAREWGLPPLARRPRAEIFDPAERPRWTLCMAIAWIAWRDAEAVREAMEDYRANRWVWVSCRTPVQINGGNEWIEVEGEELVPLEPTSVTLMAIAEASDADEREAEKIVSVKTARDDLWRKFAAGDVLAAGINAAGSVEVIPPHEWGYLQLAGRRSGADYLVHCHDKFRSAYTAVTVPSEALLHWWPAPAKAGQAQPVAKPSSRPEAPLDHGRKFAAARLALTKLYPDGIPAGLSDKARLSQINDQLRRDGCEAISLTTLRRVINS